MTAVLGISAFYHDSAAALVVDGTIVAAAQEERFTRKKHDAGFPARAIEYCLAEAGLKTEEIDYVGYYEKPLLKFGRLLETSVAASPFGFRSFLAAMPVWLKSKLFLNRELREGLHGRYRKRFVYCEHHESHAASAFYPSPFEEAAILTLDGVGEWATASYGIGRGNRIELLGELRFPHSLGMLYSAFTYFCGFRVNSGEYKLMGLAPYGEPSYADVIREKLLDLKPDGSFRLDLSYFDYWRGFTMTSRKFDRLFGGPPRRPESPISQRELDLAASIQVVTEEIILRMARHIHETTGLSQLCLAGGVALNCVANGRLTREGPFEKLWIQPAAGDAGGALGVAMLIWHQLLQQPRLPRPEDSQFGSLLGPRFDDQSIRAMLDAHGANYHFIEDEAELCRRVAQLLAEEKVVGWLQGRMEFGPRALGSRSILGDARSPRLQSVMNLKIKFRESFRPFAPVVLQERATEYFDADSEDLGPYMLTVANVREEKRVALPPEMPRRGLPAINTPRSVIPAVTHLDYSARVQTVDAARHGRFHRLLKEFESLTGSPVLINTSFNVRGEPIVCTPEDALRCFAHTNIDALVLEHCLLLREEQPHLAKEVDDRAAKEFALD
ncbi:MAG: carbamoyltransferase [Planctomycetota bacterium]